MEINKKPRRCKICGKDISDRPERALYCLDCKYKRDKASTAASKRRRKIYDKAVKAQGKKDGKPLAVVDCAIDVALLQQPAKCATLNDWVAAADAVGMSYGKYVAQVEGRGK